MMNQHDGPNLIKLNAVRDYSREYFGRHPEGEIPINDPLLRKAVFDVFGGKCFYTGQPLTEDAFTIDHVIPRAWGGPNNVYNYAPAIKRVNSAKGAQVDLDALKPILGIIASSFAPRVLREYEASSLAPHPQSMRELQFDCQAEDFCDSMLQIGVAGSTKRSALVFSLYISLSGNLLGSTAAVLEKLRAKNHVGIAIRREILERGYSWQQLKQGGYKSLVDLAASSIEVFLRSNFQELQTLPTERFELGETDYFSPTSDRELGLAWSRSGSSKLFDHLKVRLSQPSIWGLVASDGFSVALPEDDDHRLNFALAVISTDKKVVANK